MVRGRFFNTVGAGAPYIEWPSLRVGPTLADTNGLKEWHKGNGYASATSTTEGGGALTYFGIYSAPVHCILKGAESTGTWFRSEVYVW